MITPRHETPAQPIVARKKSWTVTTPGHAPFPMIMPVDVDAGEALRFARSIWPECDVE